MKKYITAIFLFGLVAAVSFNPIEARADNNGGVLGCGVLGC